MSRDWVSNKLEHIPVHEIRTDGMLAFPIGSTRQALQPASTCTAAARFRCRDQGIDVLRVAAFMAIFCFTGVPATNPA